MIELFQDYRDFNKESIFCKNILLEYKAVSEQPWVYFNCLDNELYSFRIHDLQLGNREANEESIFWHLTAQNNEKITFKGFVNKLYSKGIGSLRGYLNTEICYCRTGIVVKSNKIVKVRTHKQLSENSLFFYAGAIAELNKKGSLPTNKSLDDLMVSEN